MSYGKASVTCETSQTHLTAKLAEYQMCNEQILRSVGLVWQSTALIVGFALTGAVLVFQYLGTLRTQALFPLTVASLIVIVALALFWLRLVRREEGRQAILYAYMRVIESSTEGMRAVSLVHVLDKGTLIEKQAVFADLAQGDRTTSESYKRKNELLQAMYVREGGWYTIKALIVGAGLLWCLVILSLWWDAILTWRSLVLMWTTWNLPAFDVLHLANWIMSHLRCSMQL
ncbi:MAG: hypothetical protein M1370_04345 [Bacteroidetes bacterium]|nr:hypothetical protein [Bacteroidota bacterium]MCL5025594.1 hypothetical protein [Chloroflexota bacterium]